MKAIDSKKIKTTACHLANKEGRKEFPQLWGFFADGTLTSPDGDKERQPGTMWVGVRDGQFQVVLKEPTQALVLRVECPSLLALLTVLEAALGAEGSMWELDQYAKPGGKRKGR